MVASTIQFQGPAISGRSTSQFLGAKAKYHLGFEWTLPSHGRTCIDVCQVISFRLVFRLSSIQDSMWKGIFLPRTRVQGYCLPLLRNSPVVSNVPSRPASDNEAATHTVSERVQWAIAIPSGVVVVGEWAIFLSSFASGDRQRVGRRRPTGLRSCLFRHSYSGQSNHRDKCSLASPPPATDYLWAAGQMPKMKRGTLRRT